jgi:hypothetical protein
MHAVSRAFLCLVALGFFLRSLRFTRRSIADLCRSWAPVVVLIICRHITSRLGRSHCIQNQFSALSALFSASSAVKILFRPKVLQRCVIDSGISYVDAR